MLNTSAVAGPHPSIIVGAVVDIRGIASSKRQAELGESACDRTAEDAYPCVTLADIMEQRRPDHLRPTRHKVQHAGSRPVGMALISRRLGKEESPLIICIETLAGGGLLTCI